MEDREERRMSHPPIKPLLERGTVLGDKWEILAHIASGGKGQVYRARQKTLGRDVAVKIISPEFLDTLAENQEEATAELSRFRREVMAMARVRHPNVLQVYDYDRVQVEGRTLEYIAMEYVPGSTLRRTMPKEGMKDDEPALRDWILRYFLPVLDGVEAVHKLEIVHRDLKPENVLLDGETPKITDFGLAGGGRWQPLTRSHHAFGTLPYMASEQFTDMDLTDARADVYSLGKILYEAAVGKMEKGTSFPFQTVSLPDPGTPFLKALDEIIRRATARELAERLASAAEFRELLERVLKAEPSPLAPPISVPMARHPAGRLKKNLSYGFTGLLVVFLALVLAYHFYTTSKENRTTQVLSPASTSETAGSARNAQAPPDLPRVPGARIFGQDGAALRYVPGGAYVLDDGPDRPPRRLVIAPFFMDEDEVTVHQYVEFLNRVRGDLTIEDSTVRKGDEIWLILGEVTAGYEPIVFRDGRFMVSDPARASNPVVRVTALGAQAYARYYGRRLPTMGEWFHAAGTRHQSGNGAQALGPPSRGPAGSSAMMHGAEKPLPPEQALGPVGQGPANGYGLRGLGSGASEWARGETRTEEEGRFYVLGGLSGERPDTAAPAVKRLPWEAFATVGFRTVLPAGPR